MNRLALLTLAFMGIGVCNSAGASDFFGLYAGAAVGRSEVRLDRSFTATADNFDHSHVGWKATLGLRPIPILGAELQYLDFGDIGYTNGTAGPATVGRVKSKAVTLMAVGYLPLPLPLLDIYGKFGVARSGADVTGNIGGLFCPSNFPTCSVLRTSSWQTSPAYGAGIQLKLASFALRTEYERIAASHGQPDLLSVGATFRFGAR